MKNKRTNREYDFREETRYARANGVNETLPLTSSQGLKTSTDPVIFTRGNIALHSRYLANKILRWPKFAGGRNRRASTI